MILRAIDLAVPRAIAGRRKLDAAMQKAGHGCLVRHDQHLRRHQRQQHGRERANGDAVGLQQQRPQERHHEEERGEMSLATTTARNASCSQATTPMSARSTILKHDGARDHRCRCSRPRTCEPGCRRPRRVMWDLLSASAVRCSTVLAGALHRRRAVRAPLLGMVELAMVEKRSAALQGRTRRI
jgi:hypothetical protein